MVLLIFHRKTPGKLSDVRIYNTLLAGIVYIGNVGRGMKDCGSIFGKGWFLSFLSRPKRLWVPPTFLTKTCWVPSRLELERLQLCICNILYHADVKICLHFHVFWRYGVCHSSINIFHSKFSLDENKTITDGVIVCGLMWPSARTFIWSWKGECNCMHSEVGWAYFEVTTSIRL